VSSSQHKFVVGALYSNEEIYKALGVGNTGGLRFNIADGVVRRAGLFTAVPDAKKKIENPYHDRIENGVLIYTAAGREGDQTLSGMNTRLVDQLSQDYPIHGFIIVANRKDKAFGPKRWQYLGLLEYLRHFQDTQIDARGTLRKVWIFELRVHSVPEVVPLDYDTSVAHEILKTSRKENPRSEEELSVVANPSSTTINAKKIEAVRAKLLAVAPKRFEELLKELLVKTGFANVHVTRYSQDGGVDLNAYPSAWALGSCLLQIQAKRWIHSVGRREVAELRGSVEPFARGTLITTSHFTRAALSDARAPGKLPIHLVNGFELAQVIITNGAESLCDES
jgi:HJR/Mrr/RecB family endonuclease